MKPSHRDRLIAALPADLQAGLLDALKSHSPDGNDMVEAIFAAVVETEKRNSARIEAKLAASESREKQLSEQLAKTHAENIKTIRQEIGVLNRDSYWHSIISSKIIGAIIWTVCVMISSFAIQKIFLQRELSPLQQIISAHREALETINNDPESLVAFAKYTSEANEDALQIAESLHSINKLMALPQMQMYRGDDGLLTIYGPKSSMTIGTTDDGKNWVKIADPQALLQPNTPPEILRANEARKKLDQK